jgi:hypothetical protein
MFNEMFTKVSDWAKAVWTKSWTTAWGKLQMWLAGITGALSGLYPWVNDPTLKGYLDTIHVPPSVSIGLGVLGMITWVAHGRQP